MYGVEDVEEKEALVCTDRHTEQLKVRMKRSNNFVQDAERKKKKSPFHPPTVDS